MKTLNWIGAILGTSVLIVPWLGISKEVFHLLYGLLYLMFTLVYAGQVITQRRPLPGFDRLGIYFSRTTINTLMMTMVLAVTIYAAYGVQGWLLQNLVHG